MTRHIDDGLLQDFHEGLLDTEAEAEVRAHLETCSACREELELLEGFLGGLGKLPMEAQPSRDLWPQIAWRMDGARTGEWPPADLADPLAVEHGEGSPGRSRVTRRFYLPAWQLLAAGIAIMVISGGAVWAFLSGGPSAGVPSVPSFESPAQLTGWEDAYGGYDEAVADLESLLERGREVLDPETARVLEESLQTIDRAIQEAGNALMHDPASTTLQMFLAENLRKKMNLLRQAAGAVYATT